MSNKLRSVNTKFWDDPFISELSPSEKLLFLYFITNPLTNLLGIYEITIKRICFDTCLSIETVQKGLERFERVRKAFFIENFVVLPNWLKNQRLNTNMKIAVTREFDNLPDELKTKILEDASESLPNGSEGFERIRKGLEMVQKSESESESEREKEDKLKKKKKSSLMSDLKKSDLSDENEKMALEYWNLFKSNLERMDIKPTTLSRAKTKPWVDEIRLMQERDGRTLEEIREIYKYLTREIKPDNGGFSWAENIRSTAKLRVKFELILKDARNGSRLPQKKNEGRLGADTDKMSYSHLKEYMV